MTRESGGVTRILKTGAGTYVIAGVALQNPAVPTFADPIQTDAKGRCEFARLSTDGLLM